jgi:hypothetical protein
LRFIALPAADPSFYKGQASYQSDAFGTFDFSRSGAFRQHSHSAPLLTIGFVCIGAIHVRPGKRFITGGKKFPDIPIVIIAAPGLFTGRIANVVTGLEYLSAPAGIIDTGQKG